MIIHLFVLISFHKHGYVYKVVYNRNFFVNYAYMFVLNKKSMKIEGVMIRDTKANKFFAFVRQFPGVCAQGDSPQEVDSKIEKNFKAFIKKMQSEKIEFTESEINNF